MSGGSAVTRTDTPFTYVPPSSRRVRLTWHGSKAMAETTASAGVQQTFKINSAYDVDPSVGSTSTAGFAEYAAFFSTYRVWGASIRFEGAASGGSSGTVAVVGMYPNATNTFLTSSDSWAVAPMSVNRTVRAETSSGGVNFFKLTKKYTFNEVLRITRRQFTDNFSYTGATSSNPATILYLSVFGFGIGTSSAVTFTYSIWVQMDVEFFNPIQLYA